MNEEDKKRIEERSVPMMHQNSPYYGITDDNVYYPVEHTQLRRLLGDLLTVLDTMNLSDRVHYATKATLTQTIWRWWDEVYDNSTTSYKGCIAPIVCVGKDEIVGDPSSNSLYPSNRWSWDSEEQYIKHITPKSLKLN